MHRPPLQSMEFCCTFLCFSVSSLVLFLGAGNRTSHRFVTSRLTDHSGAGFSVRGLLLCCSWGWLVPAASLRTRRLKGLWADWRGKPEGWNRGALAGCGR
uniref:Uncharacterized protein n=1 Tax=Gopherus agassizii TaxID=38772 RepID=A0A452ISV0_9SAUR